MTTVLVTGGSGFIASYCILKLLESGHTVRTTVRTANRADDVRQTLARTNTNLEALSFVVADLELDDDWPNAVAECDYVLHVASPFPAGLVRDENELIRPAVDGTIRVLRAARDAGVKRVVLTSSFAAVGYGHTQQSAPFNENDWTDTTQKITPYVKSKTLAERAAWDFMKREGGALQLAVINPVGVLGPVLSADYSASIQLIQQLMSGALPACPRLYFGVVDVRDVANLHVIAMTHPNASGERFLALADNFLSVLEVSRTLKRRMGGAKPRSAELVGAYDCAVQRASA
jgi:nucleoside-diphosphate-sugar epimerase